MPSHCARREQKDSNNDAYVCMFQLVCVCVCPYMFENAVLERVVTGPLGKFAPCHRKRDVNLLTSVPMWIGFTSFVHKGNYTDTEEPIKCTATMTKVHLFR